MRILVCGLPGAGKTTLATALSNKLNAVYFNADKIRKQYNDWDFSVEGRIRQAARLGSLCNKSDIDGGFVIADFVCPTTETRKVFGDAFIVWVNRITESRFENTNKIFESPDNANVIIPEGLTIEEEVNLVIEAINNKF